MQVYTTKDVFLRLIYNIYFCKYTFMVVLNFPNLQWIEVNDDWVLSSANLWADDFLM